MLTESRHPARPRLRANADPADTKQTRAYGSRENLEAHGEVRERRNPRTHPAYTKPELLACRPNEPWSWDISKLKGPRKWSWFYLYVILDVFSRYVVAWTVRYRELAAIPRR